jgi:hypothetical protein
MIALDACACAEQVADVEVVPFSNLRVLDFASEPLSDRLLTL